MADLDLDIEHYSIHDLQSFFRLSPEKKYTIADIELREYEIREQLLSSGHINKKLKRDLIDFLVNVKNRIIEEKCTKPSFPVYDMRLDKSHHPNVPYPPSNVREQDVIVNIPKPFVYTQNSEFLPGVLNPIQKRTLTRCVSIDTRFRDSPYSTTSSDFALNLPNRIPKVLSIQLNSIELSLDSLYNISKNLKNNYLYISISTLHQVYTHIFFIPDGIYTADSLLEKLNILFLDKVDTPFGSLLWKLDSSSKVILESTDDIIYSISLDFTLDENGNSDKNTTDYFCKLGRVLGFTRRKYSGESEYLSETAINMYNSFSYFFLEIDDFQNNYSPSFVSVFEKISIPNSVLARINIQENKLHFISESRTYFGPIDITRLQIRLLDSYGRVLHMNGADYSFCLLLNVVYDF
jgi:hypothetical protein